MKLADVMCIVQAWAITGILLCPAQAAAEVELPKIFSDNMVLQRDTQVAVWGWATPGETVTVEFAGQKKMTTADASNTPSETACRKNDIAIGFYFSPINWMWKSDDFPHRGFPRKNNWTRAREFVDMPKEQLQPILDKWIEQDVFPCMEELLTRYGRIDYAWFDGFNWPGCGLDFKHDEAKALLLKHQPDILLNPRYNNWGESPKYGDLGTAENHFPSRRPAGPWEFCWCMRGGWFAGGKGRDTSNGTPAVNVLANLAKCRSWDGYMLPATATTPLGGVLTSQSANFAKTVSYANRSGFATQADTDNVEG